MVKRRNNRKTTLPKRRSRRAAGSSNGQKSSRRLTDPYLNDVSPNLLQVPQQMTVTLPWSQLLTLTTTDTTLGTYTYALSANNPYDPDALFSTSYQPQGFDQWAAFYTYYYVNHAEISVSFINLSSQPLTICVGPSPDQNPSTYLIFKNQPGNVSRLMSNNSLDVFRVTMRRSTSAILNTNPRNNSAMRTSFGTPISQQWYFLVQINSVNSTTFSGTLSVTIRYNLTMSDRKKMDYS